MDRARLRNHLESIAAEGRTVTYQEVVAALDVAPPQRIHRLALALEALMDEDAAAGRPFVAAVVVSKAGQGMPAPGFFAHARALGRYRGPESGAAAADFHRRELAALQAAHAGHDPARTRR